MNLTLLREATRSDEQYAPEWIPEWFRRGSHDEPTLYAVIVHDDDVHACRDFVELLEEVFEHPQEEAYQLTRQIGGNGRAAVWKGPRDAAEKKAQSARNYQPQWRRSESVTAPHRVAEFVSPLTITVELAEDKPEGVGQIPTDGRQQI